MLLNGPSQLSLAISQANQNKTYSDNYVAQAGHLALASVADLGTAIYNSVDLFDMVEDAETSSVLDGMGAESTADFYQDNTDLVNVVSFIGGIFIPGGAAIKGSQMLRAGIKGSHFLKPQSTQATIRLAQKMVREGKRGTEQYRKVKHATLARGVSQGLVDNAAAEVAILGALNAHPLMEDYMDDLPSNFAASLAFGSVISGAVDLASSSYRFANATGQTLAEAHKPVLEALPLQALSVGEGTQYRLMQQSTKELDAIIGNAKYNEETRSFARSVSLTIDVDARRKLEAVAAPTGVPHSDVEFLTSLEDMMKAAHGVERVAFYKTKGTVYKPGPIKRLTNVFKEVVTAEGDATMKAGGIWSPQFKMFMDEESATKLATAADAGLDPRLIEERARAYVSSGQHRTGQDVSENYLFGTAADVDADYLVKLTAFDKLPLSQLKHTKIHKGDLASLHGVAARMQKEVGALDDMKAQLDGLEPTDKAFKELTKKVEKKQDQLDNIALTVVDDVSTKSALKAKRVGVKHLMDVQKAVSKQTPIADDVSVKLSGVLKRWFAGEADVDQGMRKAIADLIRTGNTDNELVKELMSSAHAKSLRESLKGTADKQGFVHLLPNEGRAMGQGFEVRTFTATAKPNARTTPVKLQNLIGMHRGPDGSPQFLAVDTTTRAVRENLDGLKLDAEGNMATGIPALKAGDMQDFATAETQRWVMQQSRLPVDEGMGIEELARRANMDTDSIKRILGMPNTEALAEVGATGLRYNKAADLASYMGNTTRMLRASDNGNLDNYYSFVKMMEVNADRKALSEWAASTTIDLMTTSQSSLITKLMDTYGARGAKGQANFRTQMQLLQRSLGFVNDELAGTRIIQSADMYARHMKDAGKLINHYGDKFTQAYNETVEAYIGPLNGSLSKIAADSVQVVTLNTALQVHRSIGDGQIKFADGVFYNKVGDTWDEVMWIGKVFRIPETMPAVREFLESASRVGDELHRMRVTKAKLTGGIIPATKGFWLPNFDLRSKNVEFVRFADAQGNTHQMIITGTTLPELATKREGLKSMYGKVKFITPKERDQGNYLKGLAEDGQLSGVDAMLQRGGKLANPLPSATLEDARGVINSLADHMFSGAKNAHGIMFDDVLGQLAKMEGYAAKHVTGQGMSKTRKLLGDPVSAATTMRETLLGSRGQLSKHVWWDKTNSAFEATVTGTLAKWNKLADTFPTREGNALERWSKLQEDLEANGIHNPYKAFDDKLGMELFHKEARPADARRVVAAGNALAATMALRFFELAQPLVNMMSMPIMAYSAGAHKYDSSFLNFNKSATPQMPMKYLMNGVRSMHDDTYKALFNVAEEKGFFKPLVSEATDVLKLTRLREKGMLSKAEAGLDRLDKSFGGKAVIASDYSETLSRKTAFATGAQLGMELYGMRRGVDDAAIMIFAKEFMDRAIGNYSASQRPVLFHGTAGAAIGLFQTYMVTMAQNLYRHAETRDFKALAGVMSTQAGLFGVGSLPGYDMVSTHIGENFSDNHTDLTTGLYRAVDDPIASTILYGLPSNLGGLAGLQGGGPSFSSRGAIEPRIPILGGEPPAAASVVIESFKALSNVASRVAQSGAGDAPAAFGEALAMQSISRPIARVAELATGTSTTRAGHTVQTPEEVYTPMGILSRILATRPTDEVKVRDAVHLNTYYGSLDRENRSKAMVRIRQAIRQSSMSPELMDEVAMSYMQEGGTAQGFRSALNQAMQAESTNMQVTLMRELKPDSPLINMMMDL